MRPRLTLVHAVPIGLLGLTLVLEPGSTARATEHEMSPDRQRQVLRDALSAFDDAVALAPTKPADAQAQYRKAATAFETLAQAGLRNAALEYNLGNAYMRLGRLGEAIVHYLRAHRLDPGNPKLRANLSFARRQVEPLIEASGEDRLLRRVLFWHYGTSLRGRFLATAVLSGAGWMLLIVRLRWAARPVLVLGVVSVVLGLACASSVAWQRRDESRCPWGVIVGQEQTLRLGRGEAYEPALKQPLGPGVEVRMLQRRGDWIEARLANDQVGWLPAESVLPV